MPFPHQHLAQTISDQLNVLAAQLKTRTRASQSDANHWLESVMARFFNALFGWDLVNLNADQPNFPAADLGDRSRRIAMQITNQDAASKITETAEKAKVHRLGVEFDRLILFFLLPKKPAMPKRFVQLAAGLHIECWDIADLLKRMPELLDQSCLSAAAVVLAEALGITNPEAKPPPSNLPGGYIGQPFVGRKKYLKDLRASLLKQMDDSVITQRPAATVIGGLGGMGKTHVAMKYVELHRAAYKALLFISGDSPQRLQAGLAGLCEEVRGLNLYENLPKDEKERARLALDWLALHPGWLLVVDSVDDEAAALAITAHFDQLRNGHVLITSRLGIWSSQVDVLTLLELSPEDSAALLLQLTRHRREFLDDAEQARNLAGLMEGLPLALHQAAGYINEQCCALAQYLAAYQEKAADLLNWFNSLNISYERPDKLAPRPVLITWKTTFDKLSEETRFWLLVFSYFAPEPIPEIILEPAPNRNAEIKDSLSAARRAIAQAWKFCLLNRYKDDSPRFKIHRLVQEVTRLNASAAARDTALEQGILLIRQSDPGKPQDVRTWKRWTPLQSHALVLCQHSPDEHESVNLTWLLSQLGTLLKTKCLFEQAESLQRRALRIDEIIYGPDHPEVAIVLNNLGMLLQDTNQMDEAESLLRRALKIDEANLGKKHPKVAVVLNNLATLLMDTNRMEEAESLLRRALKIEEASHGKKHPNVARCLNNLAMLFQSINRLADAEPLIRRALRIDEASYEANHPEIAVGLSNLGTLLHLTNRTAEAEPLLRRALQIDEDSFGPDHSLVAIRLSNLAQVLHDTKRLAEAELLMRRALLIDEACYGKEHPYVARDLNNLAYLLCETRRLEEAELLFRRVLGILGVEHPHSESMLENYGRLLHALKIPKAKILRRMEVALFGEQ